MDVCITKPPPKNRGKNYKGQTSRAKEHQSGPVKSDYIQSSKQRHETFSTRSSTLVNKCKQLHTMTGAEISLCIIDEDGKKIACKTNGHAWESQSDSTCNQKDGKDKIGKRDAQTSTDEAPEEKRAASVTGFPSPPPRKRRIPTVRAKKTYTCEKCGVDYSKDKRKETWLGCSHNECDNWVHARCIGIVVRRGRQCLENVDYFCQTHIKYH